MSQQMPVQEPQGAFISRSARPSSGFAVASLVLGILGVIFLRVIGPILALVFGYVGRSRIKSSGGREGGSGMAIAGIVLGWVGIGIDLLIVGLFFVGSTHSSFHTNLHIGHLRIYRP
jgi:hypothetical protein